MQTKSPVRILCVDDEPHVLEGLSLHLRRRYEVETATSGAAGLEILQRNPPMAVVMSDMRMPRMDGSAFLALARQKAPDAVRILLTGQADLDSAIAAVNEGQIFRFLTKPCPPPTLLAAVDSAADQHRLVMGERILLEQTLHGSIKALTDALSITSPVSFGRATRIKRHVSDLAAALKMTERWQVEVAAMLSQLGCITLPAEAAEKFYYGQSLSEHEQKMVSRLPLVVEQLLGNIPRLETVRAILARYPKPVKELREMSADSDRDKRLIERSAQILKIAHDFDVLETQGISVSLALDTMRGRGDRYDPEVLEGFFVLRGSDARPVELREVLAGGLKVGMVVAEDVKLQTGALLVARGYEITESFLQRVQNFRPGSIREPVRVEVRAQKREGA